MRQARFLMMNTVKRFVQETERTQTPQPTPRDDAAGRTVNRISCQSDMLDVFPPALQVRRHECWGEIQPEKIFPQPKYRDCPENYTPGHNDERQFRPNSPPHAVAPHRR